jgi:hypothetical protein
MEPNAPNDITWSGEGVATNTPASLPFRTICVVSSYASIFQLRAVHYSNRVEFRSSALIRRIISHRLRCRAT